jgi:hypothetical protein
MNTHKQLNMLGLLSCVLLLACAPAKKQYSGSAAPIDNDSYYSQPGSYMPNMVPAQIQYNGCDQINDAPSCGGG